MSPARGPAWLAVGRACAVASLVLFLLMQALHHDYFPPDISVSQYGIGPTGWVFTLWTVTLALTVSFLAVGSRALYPVSVHGAGYWLAVGCAGLLVMGAVRTDAGGAQHSWHAKLHTATSVVGLVALPIGIALALGWARRSWRRVAWSLVVLGDAALILVLASALGVSTPGMDAAHSWALWQAVAVVLDLLLVAVFALASAPIEGPAAVAGPVAPPGPPRDARGADQR